MDNKKVGFYCQLPKATVKEIKRRAKAGDMPQWYVLELALRPRSELNALQPETMRDLWMRSVKAHEKAPSVWEGITLKRTGGPRRKARGAK